jgi:hypothetical protein
MVFRTQVSIAHAFDLPLDSMFAKYLFTFVEQLTGHHDYDGAIKLLTAVPIL